MQSTRNVVGMPALFGRRAILQALLFATSVGGCMSTVPTDNGGSDGGTGDGTNKVSASIVTPASSFGISALDPPVSVLYTVTGEPDSVVGFRIPVVNSSPSSTAIGDAVIVATELPAGTLRAFEFDPVTAGVGFFRVGVIATLGAVDTRAESVAVIQVQGPPDPRFIAINSQLVDDVHFAPRDSTVSISFDAGDPENMVAWRVFYLAQTDSRTNPADRLGTEIAVGSGNVGSVLFDTSGLAPADYELGISATDGGFSIATAVARGEGDRIVTIPNQTMAGPVVRIIEGS